MHISYKIQCSFIQWQFLRLHSSFAIFIYFFFFWLKPFLSFLLVPSTHYNHPATHFVSLLLRSDSRGLPESIPAVCGRRRGHTLDKLPVHRRATNSQARLLHLSPSSAVTSAQSTIKNTAYAVIPRKWVARRSGVWPLEPASALGLSADQRRRPAAEL